MIRASGIVKTFGETTVLSDVTLESPEGKITVIMGPNGSGKTTLLKILALLIQPDRGEVEFNGVKLNLLAEREKVVFRRRISYVPQKPPVLTTNVFNNVYIPLRLRGIEPGKARQIADEWLSTFRLKAYAKRNALSLSGGEKQLLALSRAFSLEPDILLLDEPTSHLAPQNAQLVHDVIRNYISERKAHAIVVSHSLQEAKSIYDRLIILVSGKIKASYDGDFKEEEILKWI